MGILRKECFEKKKIKSVYNNYIIQAKNILGWT